MPGERYQLLSHSDSSQFDVFGKAHIGRDLLEAREGNGLSSRELAQRGPKIALLRMREPYGSRSGLVSHCEKEVE